MEPAGRGPPAPRGAWLARTIVAALVLLALLTAVDAPLRTDTAGSGTISLELARTGDRAAEIVSFWEADGETDRAAFVLGLDFLYAALAALALAGAALAVGSRLQAHGRSRLAGTAVVLAWLGLASGVADWAENAGLAFVLLDEPVSPWPQLVFAFALVKFALVGVVLLYLLAGGLLIATSRRRR